MRRTPVRFALAPAPNSRVRIAFLAFLTSALTALVVTPLVLRALLARGIYGHARIKEGVEHTPVPRLGGVAVCIATTLALTAVPLAARGAGIPSNTPLNFFVGLLAASWLLFVTGVLDDLYGLAPRAKIAAQVAGALIAWSAGFRIEQLTFSGTLDLGALSLPVTILWIVGVTNAFNLIDGLDGLATGIGLVALATTLAVSAKLGNWEVALVCAALAGALAGFLRYNLRPARIFLGDSGSLFVGFMLAVLSVHGSTKSTTAVLTVIPLLVLGLPLLDTALAILRRWLRGAPISSPDERHLHHRLVAIGLTHTRAAVLLFLSAAGLATIALMMVFAPPRAVVFIAAGGAACTAAILLFGIKRLGYHEFVEAGAVVAGGASRLRRSIRDRIHARDVSHVVEQAESMEHLRAILTDNAEVMGMLDLVLCRCSAVEGGRDTVSPEHAATALRVDFPVHTDGDEGDPWVLRAWCDGNDPQALPEAVRTASILADSVRGWLVNGPPPRVPRALDPARAVTLASESAAW